MSEPIDPIERQMTSLAHRSAPADLRTAVLGDVNRQLRAQRWDGRLLQIAVAIFVVGIGLNASVSWRDTRALQTQNVAVLKPESIQQIAAAVAEATDAETGARFAKQLALRCGELWSEKQQADIQGRLRSRFGASKKKDG